MAKISALPHADPLSGAEPLLLLQGGVAKQAPVADLIDAQPAIKGLKEVDFIGRPVAPVDGISGSSDTRYFHQPLQRSGFLTSVWLWSSLAPGVSATVKVKVADRAGGPGTLANGDVLNVNDEAEIEITGPGFHLARLINLYGDAGQFVGFYGSALGAIDYLAATPSDSEGFWKEAGHVGDNATITVNEFNNNAQWQIGVEQEVLVVTKERVAAVDAKAESALKQFTDIVTIGRAGALVAGVQGTPNTRTFDQPLPRAMRMTRIRLRSMLAVGATAVLKIKPTTRDAGPGDLELGDGITTPTADTVTIMGGGDKEFDVDITFEPGQFVSWHFSALGGVAYLAATPSDSGGFWTDTTLTGDNDAMTVNAKFTNFQWQIAFEFEDAVVTKDTGHKADFAYAVASSQLGRKPRPIPAITADIDWAMCVSADFITPGQEVGTDDRLQEWLDRTGTGNTPATIASIAGLPCRPIYDPDAFGAGIPGVLFNGSAAGNAGEPRVMQLQHGMTLAQPFTYVAIIKIPALNTAKLTLADGFSSASDGDRCALGLANGGKPYVGVAPATTIISPDAISVDEPHLLIATFDGASSSLSVDGEVKATGAIFGGLDGLNLGCERGAVARFNGAVAMKGIVKGTLSATQSAAIGAYAADRYGVAIA